MKRLVMAIALTCALSGSALAGDSPTGGYAPPPPDPTHMTSASAPGEMPSGGNTLEAAPDITLMIVQAIISFLSV